MKPTVLKHSGINLEEPLQRLVTYAVSYCRWAREVNQWTGGLVVARAERELASWYPISLQGFQFLGEESNSHKQPVFLVKAA